jgi:hypothetical protein
LDFFIDDLSKDPLKYHLLSVFIVSIAFCINDFMTYLLSSGYNKEGPKKFFWILDIPIAISLLSLVIFYCWITNNPTIDGAYILGHDGSAVLGHGGNPIDTREFFIGGSIAFQMLVSNVVYVALIFTERIEGAIGEVIEVESCKMVKLPGGDYWPVKESKELNVGDKVRVVSIERENALDVLIVMRELRKG